MTEKPREATSYSRRWKKVAKKSEKRFGGLKNVRTFAV
jgi:hypothetical protein